MQECLIFEASSSDVGEKGGRRTSKTVEVKIITIQGQELI